MFTFQRPGVGVPGVEDKVE